MTDQIVHVPERLLLSGDSLPASARLVCMATRLQPAPAKQNTSWLSASTGLSRTTVLAGLAQLTAAGWHPAPAPVGATVPIPAAVLTNQKLSAQARVLYGLLLLTPGFCHPCGRFSYADLGGLAHATRNTVATALAELVEAEWIIMDRANRRAAISFELTFAGRERGEVALAAAENRLSNKEVPYGEALMREFLSLLIDSNTFEDNASPGFLVNPRTQAELQFDRFYPPKVAFEFNGPQHYRATDRFTPVQVAEQRERDYIKMGICAERGITLVIVHPEDLTLAAMQRKVANLLPLRDLSGCALLIDYLESESSTYRRRIKRI